VSDLSETQKLVMRYIRRHSGNIGGHVQIAGNGRAPWLSASRALVRKGLAITYRSGRYALTPEGREIADKLHAALKDGGG